MIEAISLLVMQGNRKRIAILHCDKKCGRGKSKRQVRERNDVLGFEGGGYGHLW